MTIFNCCYCCISMKEIDIESEEEVKSQLEEEKKKQPTNLSYYNVRCWHKERRTRQVYHSGTQNRSGYYTTETYYVDVTTFNQSFPVRFTRWQDVSYLEEGEKNVEGEKDFVKLQVLASCVWDERERVFLEQVRLRLHQQYCNRDTHIAVTFQGQPTCFPEKSTMYYKKLGKDAKLNPLEKSMFRKPLKDPLGCICCLMGLTICMRGMILKKFQELKFQLKKKILDFGFQHYGVESTTAQTNQTVANVQPQSQPMVMQNLGSNQQVIDIPQPFPNQQAIQYGNQMNPNMVQIPLQNMNVVNTNQINIQEKNVDKGGNNLPVVQYQRPMDQNLEGQSMNSMGISPNVPQIDLGMNEGVSYSNEAEKKE